jgi:hypothetical protein
VKRIPAQRRHKQIPATDLIAACARRSSAGGTFYYHFKNYSSQGSSFQRKGAKMQRTQRKYLIYLALRPLQLGVFALEADSGD